MNFPTIILFLPLFVLAFWSVEVLLSVRKHGIKWHLLSFFVSSFIAMMAGVIFFKGHYFLFRVIYIPVVLFALLPFPTFYMYIYNQSRYKAFQKRMFLHYLIPFLAMCSAAIIHFFILNLKEKETFVSEALVSGICANSKIKIAYVADRIYKNIFIVSAFFYFVLVNLKVRKHRAKIDLYFSYTEGVDFRWIRLFNVAFLLQLCGSVFYHSFDREIFIDKPILLIVPYGLTSIFYYTIGHFGSKQKKIFNISAIEKTKEPEVDLSNKVEYLDILTDRLADIMNEQKLFLKHDLNLEELATFLATNRTYLSRAINERFGMNFRQFVNDYRLKYAYDMLQNSECKLSILEVSDNCGFNSYQTFNRCFKDKYGESPSKFLEKKVQDNFDKAISS